MDKIKVIHDTRGHTLTVWLGDPSFEHVCEETTNEVVLMKDVDGGVIGFELLHYHPSEGDEGLSVETMIRAVDRKKLTNLDYTQDAKDTADHQKQPETTHPEDGTVGEILNLYM